MKNHDKSIRLIKNQIKLLEAKLKVAQLAKELDQEPAEISQKVESSTDANAN